LVNHFIYFQAEDGIRDFHVTGVQTCALPIWAGSGSTLFRETWIWDGREQTWQELTLSTQPAARKGAVMSYDPNSGKVLMFGGEGVRKSGVEVRCVVFCGARRGKQGLATKSRK